VEVLQDQVRRAVGIDPDVDSLKRHRAPRVQRSVALMEHLPFPDESFDLVLCSWVLEHLADPTRAWAEVARVLKSPSVSRSGSGGHFVFLTPNALHPLTWISRWLSRLGDWQSRLVERLYARVEADTFPVLYRANTRRRIEALAQAAGLRPVRFHRIGDPTYLAFNELFYRVAVGVERLTPSRMKVHLVGDFVKEERS
jgi:SAM-dependent methyltransferase